MFKPLLILLGAISINLAEDYSQSNAYDQDVKGFQNDYLDTAIDYHNEMIPNHSDYNGGIMIFLIFKHFRNSSYLFFVK